MPGKGLQLALHIARRITSEYGNSRRLSVETVRRKAAAGTRARRGTTNCTSLLPLSVLRPASSMVSTNRQLRIGHAAFR